MVRRTKVLFDRYRVGEIIGGGGMGSVFAAHDEVLDRPVAIKMLHDSIANDPTNRERFRREALIAASLAHPGICNVFDYQEADSSSFIVMELLEGETLHDRIRREGPLEPAVALEIVARAAEALDHAHGSGAVHRDVKPANIYLTRDGQVKLTDFGIAQVTTHETLTKVGDVLGTASYLSPEQIEGRRATSASDIYSLGCVLHEALMGHPPFVADSPVAVGRAHLDVEPPDLSALGIEPALAQVVARALTKDPSRRFESAGAMAAALRKVAGGASPLAMPLAARLSTDPDPTLVREGAADPTLAEQPPEETPPQPPVFPRWLERARGRGEKRTYRRALLAMILVAALIGGLAALASIITRSGADADRPPTEVAVPNFSGRTFEAAKSDAEALGFTVEAVPRLGARPAGTVIDQHPPPGEQVRPETLHLVVSDGAGVVVPNVTGFHKDEAKRRLEQAGLKENEADQAPGDRDDIVVAQDPPPGEVVRRETEVQLTISKEQDEEDRPPGRRGREDD
jgi:hypothetical protein